MFNATTMTREASTSTTSLPGNISTVLIHKGFQPGCPVCACDAQDASIATLAVFFVLETLVLGYFLYPWVRKQLIKLRNFLTEKLTKRLHGRSCKDNACAEDPPMYTDVDMGQSIPGSAPARPAQGYQTLAQNRERFYHALTNRKQRIESAFRNIPVAIDKMKRLLGNSKCDDNAEGLGDVEESGGGVVYAEPFEDDTQREIQRCSIEATAEINRKEHFYHVIEEDSTCPDLKPQDFINETYDSKNSASASKNVAHAFKKSSTEFKGQSISGASENRAIVNAHAPRQHQVQADVEVHYYHVLEAPDEKTSQEGRRR